MEVALVLTPKLFVGVNGNAEETVAQETTPDAFVVRACVPEQDALPETMRLVELAVAAVSIEDPPVRLIAVAWIPLEKVEVEFSLR